MIRFHWLQGDVDPLSYGGKWISNRQNNGDFDYWLVLSLDNLEGLYPEVRERYLVGLSVVAPSQVSEADLDRAVDSCGWEGLDLSNPELLVEVLDSQGTCASLGEWTGNNAHKLLRQAKREAQTAGGMFFGFAMDRAQNLIGSTGWDCLRGDILAGLNRQSGA